MNIMRLQFTVEIEKERCINLLDISIKIINRIILDNIGITEKHFLI